jgi:hypothetical protein
MRQTSAGKIIRAVLISAVLVGGVVTGLSDKSYRVHATTCDQAMDNFISADNTYEIARYSYFYDDPTSCQSDCANSQNQTQCISDCQISRHTTLAQAQIGLLNLATDTCAPYELDACAQARGMANMCVLQLNSSSYSSQEELEAVLVRYEACLTASKVDYCQ